MPEALLSTAQVARYLGVKPQTVYAYVSRGRLAPLRRTTRRGSQVSWFRLEDVERLRAGTRRGTTPAAPIQTRITAIEDDDTLLFRGRRVDELADRYQPEELCALLWQQDEAVDVTVPEEQVAALRSALTVLPEGAQPIDRMRLVVLLLGAGDPHRHDLAAGSVRPRAARVLGAVAAALLPPPHAGLRPDRDGLARLWCAVIGADPADDAQVDLVRRVLIVHADHDLATSTTAVRASANVHADLYACLLAGLSAIDSPLHGTTSVAGRLALEAAVLDPAAALGAALATPGLPAGFGHPVYRGQDPRAGYLLAHLRRIAPGPAEQAAAVLEEGLAVRRGLFPNTDWGMALATYHLGVPPHASPTLFAAARMMGWVAHTLEEYDERGPRRRLTGIYTGPR